MMEGGKAMEGGHENGGDEQVVLGGTESTKIVGCIVEEGTRRPGCTFRAGE